MNKSKSFTDLIVWQKAHQFVLIVYKTTRSYPKEELSGLTSQFRRAAVSIASNIAEGFKRRGKKDKARFYNIAQGSLEECRYYIILSHDLEYCNVETLDHNAEEIGKLLESYTQSMLNADY